jgi:3-oxoacyl-[acyl-carrier-protein] synthase-3
MSQLNNDQGSSFISSHPIAQRISRGISQGLREELRSTGDIRFHSHPALPARSQPVKRPESSTVPDPIPVPVDPRSTIPGIRIVGTGFCPASRQVNNSALASKGYDSDWILQRTGIESRYQVGPGEATSDLAIRAAQRCLESANLPASAVDLIIVATMTPDHFAPSTACLVQAQLGCQAAAFDLNAACSGFVYGLVTASQFIKSGCSRNVLVIGADTVTNLTNPQDRQTYPLFGDGAGAVLIQADPNHSSDQLSGILAYRLASEGELGKALLIPAGGSRMPVSQQVIQQNLQFLAMDGKTVFKWGVRLIPEIVSEMLFKANLSIEDIDLFIPHQANIRMIHAAMEQLNIDPDKVFINLQKYGNTSAASIPIALAEADQQGRLFRGANVLMVGFGAGLTWGASLLRW